MSTNIAPPLDLDLSSVDTGFSLLAPAFYDVVIDKVEIKKTNDGKADMISLGYKTLQPAKSNKDEQLGAGIYVFDNIMLSPTGKATWDQIVKNVGALVQAVPLPAGTKLPDAPVWVPTLQGRTIRIQVAVAPAGISAAGKSYKEKNEVTGYVPANKR